MTRFCTEHLTVFIYGSNFFVVFLFFFLLMFMYQSGVRTDHVFPLNVHDIVVVYNVW